MKTTCVVSVFVAAILVAASAGPASAEEMYGWGSAGCCGTNSGSAYGGWMSGGYGGAATVYGGYTIGYGYGGCGAGGCGVVAGSDQFWIVGDYFPYEIGHGPMFPAGNFSPVFFYTAPAPPAKSVAPVVPETMTIPKPR
jgi:hypothetical protein